MWRFVGCEAQGRGHAKAGTPCQDKTKCLLDNDVMVIALADGAGSARLSHFGASCVVESVSLYLTNHFDELVSNEDGKAVKHNILDEVLKRLFILSEELECDVNDLASTMLLAAVSGTDYIIAHIGDGVIGYLDGDELKVASEPDNGEFANVTTFVTSKEALFSMRLFKGKINDISGFVLMSDGTEQSLYHKTSNKLSNALIKLMHRACLIDPDIMKAQLEYTLHTVITKNTQDDCSMAILAKHSECLKPFDFMSFADKAALLDMKGDMKKVKKRVRLAEKVIQIMCVPKTIKQISLELHMNPKYTKRRVDKLVTIGLAKKEGFNYTSSIH